ncbi:ABC transporter permease [Tepidicaulis sp.]|uniref:ABC transporter permease n=1 Tax=Tepidicaulis sp. TaxID=1920809 RepID=UPI003B58FD9D
MFGIGSAFNTVKSLFRNKSLLWELVLRDVQESYRGSALSAAWAVLHPCVVIGVYIVVFGALAGKRLNLDALGGEGLDFTAYMLSGLVAWLAISQALVKGTSALLANSNLVKQVVFPIEALVAKSNFSALLVQLVGYFVLAAYIFVQFGEISPLLPLLPLVISLQVLMLLGLTYLLSALSVFIRDVREVVQMFATFGIFLLPIVYLPEWLPDWSLAVLYSNPLSYLIWCYQDIFFYQQIIHPVAWVALPLFSAGFFLVGAVIFQHTKQNFGDVL